MFLFRMIEICLDRFSKSFCTWPRFPEKWASELVNKWEVIFLFQFEEAIHYDTLMGFGYVTKSFDLDFTTSDSSEANFHLSLAQEFAPETAGVEMIFNKIFE